MPSNQGGYDKPFHSMSVPMGRNKEQMDEFSMLSQAYKAIEKARKSAAGKMKPAGGNGAKVVSQPRPAV